MPPKSTFGRLDAFSKTVEDARVRTTSGGIITLFSLVIMLWLAWGEWNDYRKITVHPELVVDKGRGERMEIHLNITFPKMPCEILTLDVMDVSGEVQSGIMHGINKVRLAPMNKGGHDIETKALDLHSTDDATHLDPNYCGTCGGAPVPPNVKKDGCCNTCTEVRDAYAQLGWTFGRGENIEQCQREHYSEHLDEQREEGCRVEGAIRVNKVVGNFHFAPGRSFSNGPMHLHDMETFFNTPVQHTFTHIIHELRFGPQLTEDVVKRFSRGNGKKKLEWTQHHQSPLDNTHQETDEVPMNFMYFIKVVSTAYLPLGWDKDISNAWSGHDDVPHELIDLGQYGLGALGSIETHQYSVTSHHRNVAVGGSDEKEGHAERLHSKGGLPGVFFSYDISPMKVINKELRDKSFSAFLVGVCAVVGGTLTVAAAIDRALYAGSNTLNKLKEK